MPFDATPEHLNAGAIRVVDGMMELLATPERWIQFAVDDETGHCVIGAAWRVAGFDDETGHYVVNAMHAEAGMKCWLFNDAPTTTHADILALLRRVRGRLEG